MNALRPLRAALALGLGFTLGAAACKPAEDPQPQVQLDQIPGHDPVAQDNTHKESPRLVPAESYLRTYLQIFGGLSALEAQQQLIAGGGGLFDNWASYLGALGLPTYQLDLPRKGETNALMVATFERLGVALCDKALEKDLKATPAVPVAQRLVYAFDLPQTLDPAAFAARFDVLHRTFLGYPAALAPTERTARFYKLYQDTAAAQPKTGVRFSAAEAGWAAVCYGLVRHPELHLY